MQEYDIVTHDGRKVDRLTHEALLEAERRLGYALTVVQGSYNKGVGASAGTHDGGGAVDLAPYDWQNKVKTLRAVGFAAWYRPTLPGVWGAHIHAVLIGNDRLDPSAARQVAAYYAGRNGLANNDADHSWRPSPIPVFKWAPSRESRGNHIDSALLHLDAAKAGAGSARALGIAAAQKALRSVKVKTTTKPHKHSTKRHKSREASRGYAVDSALGHIARALRLAGPARRKRLVAARKALRAVREV